MSNISNQQRNKILNELDAQGLYNTNLYEDPEFLGVFLKEAIKRYRSPSTAIRKGEPNIATFMLNQNHLGRDKLSKVATLAAVEGYSGPLTYILENMGSDDLFDWDLISSLAIRNQNVHIPIEIEKYVNIDWDNIAQDVAFNGDLGTLQRIERKVQDWQRVAEVAVINGHRNIVSYLLKYPIDLGALWDSAIESDQQEIADFLEVVMDYRSTPRVLRQAKLMTPKQLLRPTSRGFRQQ